MELGRHIESTVALRFEKLCGIALLRMLGIAVERDIGPLEAVGRAPRPDPLLSHVDALYALAHHQIADPDVTTTPRTSFLRGNATMRPNSTLNCQHVMIS